METQQPESLEETLLSVCDPLESKIETDLAERARRSKVLKRFARLTNVASNVTAPFERIFNWPKLKLLNDLRFTFQDENFATLQIGDQEFAFSWFPKLIVLSGQVILWNKGVVKVPSCGDPQIDTNTIRQGTEEILLALGLVALSDADTPTQVIYKDKLVSGVFYFNPEFPEGWSENHVIPQEK